MCLARHYQNGKIGRWRRCVVQVITGNASGKSRMWKVRRGDNQPVCYNHRVFVSTIIYSAASPARRKVETRAPVIAHPR